MHRRSDRAAVAQRLKAAGLKFTHQRLAIYEALAAAVTHPTAEEIHGLVKAAYPMLSLNTVYTTLETLQSLGLIQQMRFLDNTARYDANVDAHHHVICLACRKIEDFGRVLACRFPTVQDSHTPAWAKRGLRLLSSWRYAAGLYGFSWELELARRLVALRDPAAESV